MGKLKGMKAAAKKAAKKVVKKTAPRKDKTMGDEMDELNEQITQLTNENEELKTKVEELESSLAEAEESKEPARIIKKQWTRGKLPGEKLIKTNNQTGKFEEITRAEWDALV
jgi:predicted  nucleic acid-binding Zn-ribbon protein